MATRALIVAGKQQRFLAQHEHRCLAEEMHADDGAARRNGTNAVGEGGDGSGGVGHFILSFRGASEASEPGIHNHRPGLWIPGPALRAVPE